MSDSPSQFNATPESQALYELMSKSLSIPDYQRSYSWSSSHVRDLLNDISNRTRPYLLGTVILHNKEEGKYDIVDGQQRLITLTVLLKLLGISDDKLPLLDALFSDCAAKVIRNTRKVIADFLKDKDDNQKKSLKSWLWPDSSASTSQNTLVFFVLILSGTQALDRAYTFFDSMNSKGLSLTDFNLLKAHHLMFIPTEQEDLAQTHSDRWESYNDINNKVFTQCLRRLRMWARGADRDTRGERPDYNEFVSVCDPSEKTYIEHALMRYMQPAVFRSWRRDGARIVFSMDYPIHECEDLIPTEITQTIEGGDPFFIYANRYHALYLRLFDNMDRSVIVSPGINFIRGLMNSYGGWYKSIGYLREVLRPTLLMYVDKFGEVNLPEVATCLEIIISAKLWSAKKNGLRIEGVLTYIRDLGIVPALNNSTIARHAVNFLFEKARRCPTIQTAYNFQKQHAENLNKFYGKWAVCISDERILELITRTNKGVSK